MIILIIQIVAIVGMLMIYSSTVRMILAVVLGILCAWQAYNVRRDV